MIFTLCVNSPDAKQGSTRAAEVPHAEEESKDSALSYTVVISQ